MTAKERRYETLKAKTLAAVVNKPGITAAELPVAQRGFLRVLEKMDFILYKDEGWHVKLCNDCGVPSGVDELGRCENCMAKLNAERATRREKQSNQSTAPAKGQ